MFEVNQDAWASGQVQSKLWLCNKLEQFIEPNLKYNVAILGGWYGMLPFLMLSREYGYKQWIKSITSFDIDDSCTPIANMVNENWIWQECKFKSSNQDANLISLDEYDLIVNTSSEHFDSMDWFDHIPSGTLTVIQSNDMEHDDHLFHINSELEMVQKFPLNNIDYVGNLFFNYVSWTFTRYMVIGRK